MDVGNGRVAIRQDWVNDGEGLRGRRGLRAGRQFLLPGFRPTEIARAKPAGTLRIVALGGSTAYGLYVGADAAFIAVLGKEIAAATGLPVEVVNLGCAGFASDRELALLPTALALEPDLVVIYGGHNEMLAGDVGAPGGLTPALRLRAALLERSALFAWLDHAWIALLRSAETESVREEVAALEAGEIPTFVTEGVPASLRVPPSEAFRARAAEHYRANLTAMIALGRSAGVPLLFPLPVANLRVPPTFSVHAPGFTAEREFEGEMRAAAALREAGKHAEELAAVDRALALSPEYGLANYARGEALRALGRDDEARVQHYQRDRSHLPHHVAARASLRRRRRRGGGALGRSAAALPREPLRRGGARLFIDHVHPTAADTRASPMRCGLRARAATVARRASPSREGETR